jgi:[ribosomal protein S18]-alanine N-acetyltransferase
MLYRPFLHDAERLFAIGEACGLGRWTADDHRAEIQRSDSIVLCCLYGGEIAGFVSGRIIGEGEEQFAELNNIAVLPSAAGTGYGRELLSAFLKEAAERGCGRVFLEVRESNVRAISLYETSGFLRVGRRRSFYSDPAEDALLLEFAAPTTEIS